MTESQLRKACLVCAATRHWLRSFANEKGQKNARNESAQQLFQVTLVKATLGSSLSGLQERIGQVQRKFWMRRCAVFFGTFKLGK